MANTYLSDHIFRSIPCTSRRLNHTGISLSPPNNSKAKSVTVKTGQKPKWVVRLSLVEQNIQPKKSTTVDVERLVGFLYEDLPHLFDDQGIDRTAYDERVKFRDPITKHDSISGYLFNIALLKKLFRPDFQLHWVKQTGPFDITTRWTMVMTFALLPWKPELVFTGTSIMGINPETGKFCSHVDFWDSITNNNYFSSEGLMDVIKQLRIYKTPNLDSPKYQILKRTANYEVRKYTPFVVVETDGDKLSGSAGFNAVTGYIFGKNSTKEKIPMTTPVFTQAVDSEMSKISIQVVLPSEKEMTSLPAPDEEKAKLRKVEGGIAAVSKFSGKPTEDVVREKEKSLRSSLIKDGLRPETGCLLARYNDPGRTKSFMMKKKEKMQRSTPLFCFLVFALWLVVANGSEPTPKIGIYELKTGDFSVKFTTWGARIVSLVVPDKNGKLEDIVLGYDSAMDYLNDTTYFGATVGRVANRIGGAQFTLNGIHYKLDPNDGKNTLHGGSKGYGRVVWKVRKYHNEGPSPYITFGYHSYDGEEGEHYYLSIFLLYP
ncbi:hypothetical protein RHMOL_Rhmol08G0076500 [Rhododendron molle]|uniref:Uncharacterized protein n=1 Tax=Rhododendron molle TaxID=49168 RepID=A0ACC0MKY0_RHOML|nr:hypothetical protein RHMOL_Rhmol08G0076500 [Rhododendron molle]